MHKAPQRVVADLGAPFRQLCVQAAPCEVMLGHDGPFRGESIEHVTAPDVANVQIVAQQAFAAEAEFLGQLRDAVLSGWMKACTRCRLSSPKQKSSIAEIASAAMPCRWRAGSMIKPMATRLLRIWP